jgi:hypothetical protein
MTETTGPEPTAEQAAPQGRDCGHKGRVLSEMFHKMMPSAAAGEHFRNARIEMLKGFRELLDQRIQTISQRQQRGTKLNVE